MKRNLLAVLCLAGCAAPQVYTPETAPEYALKRETRFFAYGPAQAGRPEKLPMETEFRVLHKGVGYTQILLPDERTGFVATEDIQPAAPMGVAVAEDELFPDRQPSGEPLPVVEAPLPEPDLQLPVEDVPAEKPKKKR
jgi:hypothetical protein